MSATIGALLILEEGDIIIAILQNTARLAHVGRGQWTAPRRHLARLRAVAASTSAQQGRYPAERGPR
eukprot:scaffold13348_cov157-Isochrysis_galbana.AAC.2